MVLQEERQTQRPNESNLEIKIGASNRNNVYLFDKHVLNKAQSWI